MLPNNDTKSPQKRQATNNSFQAKTTPHLRGVVFDNGTSRKDVSKEVCQVQYVACAAQAIHPHTHTHTLATTKSTFSFPLFLKGHTDPSGSKHQKTRPGFVFRHIIESFACIFGPHGSRCREGKGSAEAFSFCGGGENLTLGVGAEMSWLEEKEKYDFC